MGTAVTKDQAEAILSTVTGLPADHPERNEIAREMSDALAEAAAYFEQEAPK